MSENLKEAAKRLLENEYTCCLFDGKTFKNSKERGVKPLLELLSEGFCGKGFSAVDKVVGMGAAYLYAMLGVCEVKAYVLSEGGKRVLERFGVPVTSDKMVPYIINRKGDGICPIEGVLSDSLTLDEALATIKNRLKELQNK